MKLSVTEIVIMYIAAMVMYIAINSKYGVDWFIDFVFVCYSILTLQSIVEIKITKTRD